MENIEMEKYAKMANEKAAFENELIHRLENIIKDTRQDDVDYFSELKHDRYMEIIEAAKAFAMLSGKCRDGFRF